MCLYGGVKGYARQIEFNGILKNNRSRLLCVRYNNVILELLRSLAFLNEVIFIKELVLVLSVKCQKPNKQRK